MSAPQPGIAELPTSYLGADSSLYPSLEPNSLQLNLEPLSSHRSSLEPPSSLYPSLEPPSSPGLGPPSSLRPSLELLSSIHHRLELPSSLCPSLKSSSTRFFIRLPTSIHSSLERASLLQTYNWSSWVWEKFHFKAI